VRPRLRPHHAALLAILVAAAVVRFGRIDAGLPGVFLADEELVTKNALSLAARKTLRPLYFDYPTLHLYLLSGVYAGLFVAGRATGAYASPADFAARFFVDPSAVYLAGRAASAAFSVGAVLVAYLLGKRLYGTRAGLLGALLLAFAIEPAREAALTTPNATLSFLAILAFLPILAVAARGERRDYLLAGAAIGLSVAAKYNSGLLVLPLALAHFTARDATGARRPLRPLLLAGCTAAAAFLLFTPYWVLDFPAFLERYRHQAAHMRTGHVGHMGKPTILWAIAEIVREERTAGILAFAGVVLALARRARGDLLLLAFAVPSFLGVASLANQQLDYLAFVWPPAAVLAGRALDALLAAGPLARSRALAAVVGALAVAPSAAGALAEFRAARAPDTRTVARAWIEANLPSETGVAFDRYHSVAPLLDANRARRSEVGRRHVGDDVLAALDRALAGRPTYRLVPILVATDAPLFPPEVDSLPDPAAYRARASRNPYLAKEVLCVRNRSVDELRAEGAEYVILSSIWTDRFLREPPPPETNLLYISWLRDRRALERLLGDPRLVEVRRWEPGGGHVGPRLTLYEIEDG
jgi:hypothetical protein